MSIRQTAREGFRITGYLIFAIALALILLVAGIATWTGVAPWVEDTKREIIQNSQQYQETQVQGIRDQILQYEDNMVTLAELGQNPDGNTDVIEAIERQQAGILRFIDEQVKKLNPSSIPDDVSTFVNNNL